MGVVGDVRQVELDEPTMPEIYFPMVQNWSQVADLGMTLVVRTSSHPDAMIEAVRLQVREVNPRIAIFNVRTMEQVVTDSLWNLNLYRWLIGWFAGLTLVLSAVGLYGVLSYNVAARRREWAVRLALGSAPREVAQLVLRRGLALALAGTATGAVLMLLVISTMNASLPFGGNARGSILLVVGALIIVIALCSSWLPAIRVARTAPAAALRHD